MTRYSTTEIMPIHQKLLQSLTDYYVHTRLYVAHEHIFVYLPLSIRTRLFSITDSINAKLCSTRDDTGSSSSSSTRRAAAPLIGVEDLIMMILGVVSLPPIVYVFFVRTHIGLTLIEIYFTFIFPLVVTCRFLHDTDDDNEKTKEKTATKITTDNKNYSGSSSIIPASTTTRYILTFWMFVAVLSIVEPILTIRELVGIYYYGFMKCIVFFFLVRNNFVGSALILHSIIVEKYILPHLHFDDNGSGKVLEEEEEEDEGGKKKDKKPLTKRDLGEKLTDTEKKEEEEEGVVVVEEEETIRTPKTSPAKKTFQDDLNTMIPAPPTSSVGHDGEEEDDGEEGSGNSGNTESEFSYVDLGEHGIEKEDTAVPRDDDKKEKQTAKNDDNDDDKEEEEEVDDDGVQVQKEEEQGVKAEENEEISFKGEKKGEVEGAQDEQEEEAELSTPEPEPEPAPELVAEETMAHALEKPKDNEDEKPKEEKEERPETEKSADVETVENAKKIMGEEEEEEIKEQEQEQMDENPEVDTKAEEKDIHQESKTETESGTEVKNANEGIEEKGGDSKQGVEVADTTTGKPVSKEGS